MLSTNAKGGAMIRPILVGVAGTPATEAKIADTVELAARHGAAVSAMSVVDVDRLSKVGPVPIGGAHYAKQMRDDRVTMIRQTAQTALERFEAACADAGVPLSVIREEKDPFNALLQGDPRQTLRLNDRGDLEGLRTTGLHDALNRHIQEA